MLQNFLEQNNVSFLELSDQMTPKNYNIDDVIKKKMRILKTASVGFQFKLH